MLEKWKSASDNKKSFGALLADLSKAFDCLSHESLIAKLNAYGSNMSALRFVHSYLKNHMQIPKINSEYSSWEEIVFGVPQGSILGPLLFNIFLCALFLISSYADDSTPYTTRNSIEEVIQKLDNQMKANPGKCHFLCNSNSEFSLTIETQKIKSVNLRNCLVLNWIED